MAHYVHLQVSTESEYALTYLAFAGCSRVHFWWAEGKAILFPKMFGCHCGQCYA